mmetsp:Transcript_12782/g.21611  ORF Transcript_12782/g.21611 Transcript_12782/m.21611 type:complete len:212 (+) Transcript_12782:864-1499(+)
MLCLDIWAGCLIFFSCGYLGVTQLAAQILLQNIMVVLYMVGAGLDQASCAIVGQQIGSNNVKMAKVFYDSFRRVTVVIILLVMTFQYIYRREIVMMFTDNKEVEDQALGAIVLFVFNIFPDLFKGMLKGIIKALGIQYKAVYVHLICHWGIYPLGAYFFAFYLGWGVEGIWISKIILEWSIVSMYTYIIYFSNWHEIAEKSAERRAKAIQE